MASFLDIFSPDLYSRSVFVEVWMILTYTFMRNLVVECVWPDGRIRHRGGDGAVVHEAKLFHHEELPVPADAEEGHPHATDVLHVDTAESGKDIRIKGCSHTSTTNIVFTSLHDSMSLIVFYLL